MNKKFQNAISKTAQACPPIWFMRQAGRYHQHYQKMRAQYSFMELCKKPKIAAEVALGPIQDFDFDVAILFSDLLFPLEAMGMGLTYDPGPKLGWHLQSTADLKKLATGPKITEQLHFQKEACQETRKILPEDKSLIGFVGGAWTLFSYAVAGSHDASAVKKNLALFQPFCEILKPMLEQNIRWQLEGGAEVVMVLDTSAGDLSPAIFKSLIFPWIRDLARVFPGKLGYYTKGTNNDHLEPLLKVKELAGLGVDHRWDLEKLLPRTPGLLQGNFDQQLLFLPPQEFEKAFRHWIEPLAKLSSEERAGWVCGLGHGILPQTPEVHVKNFVKWVREVFGG